MGSCLLIHSSLALALALALEEELDTYLLPSLELLHADSIMTITCPLHRVFCFSGQHKTLISQTEMPSPPGVHNPLPYIGISTLRSTPTTRASVDPGGWAGLVADVPVQASKAGWAEMPLPSTCFLPILRQREGAEMDTDRRRVSMQTTPRG